MDIGAFLKKVGRTLAFSGGTATGPLFGTVFIEAGKALEGKETLSLEDWVKAKGLFGFICAIPNKKLFGEVKTKQH